MPKWGEGAKRRQEEEEEKEKEKEEEEEEKEKEEEARGGCTSILIQEENQVAIPLVSRSLLQKLEFC